MVSITNSSALHARNTRRVALIPACCDSRPAGRRARRAAARGRAPLPLPGAGGPGAPVARPVGWPVRPRLASRKVPNPPPPPHAPTRTPSSTYPRTPPPHLRSEPLARGGRHAAVCCKRNELRCSGERARSAAGGRRSALKYRKAVKPYSRPKPSDVCAAAVPPSLHTGGCGCGAWLGLALGNRAQVAR
jgi:hypothetical protein